MGTNKNLLAVAAGLAVCAALVWFSTSIQGREKAYEIEPQITVPEYRTDAARAIDAYERLMERYMDVTERSLIGLSISLKGIDKKLNSIDAKLTKLSARMDRIEKALGTEKAEEPTGQNPQPAKTQEKSCEKSSPPAKN